MRSVQVMSSSSFAQAERGIGRILEPQKGLQRNGNTITHATKDKDEKVDKVAVIEIRNGIEHPGAIVLQYTAKR